LPTERSEATRLTVHVHPRASRNEVVAHGGRSVRLRVTAPPAGGAANDAVRALLAETLGCPRSAVTILRGHTTRTKLVAIDGLAPDDVGRRLAAAVR
jgi:hypothetical protein